LETSETGKRRFVFVSRGAVINNMISRLGNYPHLKSGYLIGQKVGKALCARVLSAAANLDVKAALLMSKLGKEIDVRQSAEGRKMLDEKWYTFSDPLLTQARDRAEALYSVYNRTGAWQQEARKQILEMLLGSVGQGASIRPPFHCDYGRNIYLGTGVDINFGCVILDCGGSQNWRQNTYRS